MSYEATVAALTFLCLGAAGLGTLFLHGRLPEHMRDAKTLDIVRQVSSIIGLLASLVLGLMVSAASTNFDDVDDAIHGYATEIILLDRALRAVGPDGEPARAELIGYVSTIVGKVDVERPATDTETRSAEATLRDISEKLAVLKPVDADAISRRDAAKTEVATLLRTRWAILDRTEGTVPLPLVVSMVLWFALVMASIGYAAPRNAVVITSLLAASILLAGAIYLVLEMARPFDGLIQVSSDPFIHAYRELRS